MIPRQYLYLTRVGALLGFILCIFWISSNFEHSPDSLSVTQKQRPSAIVVPDIDGKRHGLRIAIITFITSEKSYTYLSLKNKNVYANKHNYTLIVDYEAPEKRGVMWHKLHMVERVIREGQHDWVWWIDFDTLFTNMTAKVDDVIDESLAGLERQRADEVDFLLTPDCFELNAGSMLVRSRPSAFTFFDSVRAYHDTHPDMSEQDCMRDIIKSAAILSSPFHRPLPAAAHDAPVTMGEKGIMHHHNQVLMIPQWKINAFPEEINCHEIDEKAFQRGMLMIHFAGAWAHVKGDDPTGELMRKYAGMIVGEGKEE